MIDPRPGSSPEPRDPDGGDAPEGRDRSLDSFRWWLNLQIALGLAGGVTWFAGAMWEEDFLTGAGCGLIAAALVLRLGRRAAED